MGLFVLLTWVVFTLFGVTLTLEVDEKNLRYRITPFSGVILTPQYLGSFLLLKRVLSGTPFWSENDSPQKITPL